MSSWDLITVAIAPALFWAGYHYYKDRHRPEPLGNLVLVYLLGIAAGWLGSQAYRGLEVLGLRYDAYALAETSLPGLFVYAILVIGLLEEGVKFLPFLFVALRLEHFDEPVDGIIYASFIGLGFATYESVHYLAYLDGPEALARGIAAPLVHVMFASIWGYTTGMAKLRGGPVWPAALLGLGIASLAHGCFDFLTIGLPAWWRVLAAALVLTVWLWRMRLIRTLHQRRRD